MRNAAPARERPSSCVLVFTEDFDDAAAPPASDDDACVEAAAAAAPPLPEPEPEPAPEPLFTRADMDGARMDGFRAGRARMLAEDDRARRRCALDEIAGTLRESRAEAQAAAARIGEELAALLLAALRASLPEYCRAHGEAEATAVVRAILPGLSHEPRATLRASEQTIAAIRSELAGLDPEAAATLTLSSSGTMADGDVSISWRHGSARRDAAAIWREIEAALALAGAPAPARAVQALKESVDA